MTETCIQRVTIHQVSLPMTQLLFAHGFHITKKKIQTIFRYILKTGSFPKIVNCGMQNFISYDIETYVSHLSLGI